MGAVDIHCREHGEGPVVVLVHGFPIEGSMWDGSAARLAGDFRVLIPDLRGFGRSPATATASMDDYADDLARLLDRLGIDRPALLAGLSFGGYVVMACMRRHADRLGAVGLVDTREAPDTPEAARARRAGADALDAGGAVGSVVDPMLPKLLGPGAGPEFVARWRRVMCAQGREGVAAAMRAIADRPDSAGTLRAFGGRALVVVGDHDAITPVADHERMAGLLRDAELRVIPGCGHMAPTERPDEFASIVRAFLLGENC